MGPNVTRTYRLTNPIPLSSYHHFRLFHSEVGRYIEPQIRGSSRLVTVHVLLDEDLQAHVGVTGCKLEDVTLEHWCSSRNSHGLRLNVGGLQYANASSSRCLVASAFCGPGIVSAAKPSAQTLCAEVFAACNL